MLGMVCFVALWTTAFFFAQLFGCRLNFYAYWRSTYDLLTKCVQTKQLFLALSITNFITDIILIIIPLPLIWRLNPSRRKKIAIVLIFSAGPAPITASLTRLIFTAKIAQAGFDPNGDPIFVITNGLYWGLLKVQLLVSTSKSLWQITSSKAKLLKSKASQISVRRDSNRRSADLPTPKNDSISVHSVDGQGEESEEANLGIEMSNLHGSNENVLIEQ